MGCPEWPVELTQSALTNVAGQFLSGERLGDRRVPFYRAIMVRPRNELGCGRPDQELGKPAFQRQARRGRCRKRQQRDFTTLPTWRASPSTASNKARYFYYFLRIVWGRCLLAIHGAHKG